MSDFITMQCPSCGGNLVVGNNALSLKCEHCGAEHMIRREAGGVILESYARCPVCNRNDKAEKATAIMSSQTHNTQGVTYQTLTTTEQKGGTYVPVNQRVAIPIKTSQMSDLAKHLTPPSQPRYKGEPILQYRASNMKLIIAILLGIFGIPSAIAILFILLLIFYNAELNSTNILLTLLVLLFGSISIVSLVISWRLFRFTVPEENKKNKEEKDEFEKKQYEIQMQSQLQFDKELKRWKIAMEHWNSLYYCSRDDCVFLPGTGTYAPVSNLIKYIYQ